MAALVPLHASALVLLRYAPAVAPSLHEYSRHQSPTSSVSDDLDESPLSLVLQAAPVAVSIGAGVPLFSAVYLPFLALGRAAEASPAIVLFLSTLLFAASNSLFEVSPSASPLAAEAANVGIACVMLWSETQRRATLATRDPLLDEDDFARFDRQLAERTKPSPKRRRFGPPRMCDAEPEPTAASAAPSRDVGGDDRTKGSDGSFDFSGMGQAFEGNRVMEMRRREADRERATPKEVLQNILNQGPGTALLLLLFALLTIGDLLFNFSRSFICVLPELCEAVVDAGSAVGGGAL